MDLNNFQRIGAVSNAHVGRDFEAIAADFFARQGIDLKRNFPASVGVATTSKQRWFDLGSEDPAVLVECKSHRWTQGKNVPSAKITVWNEAMYYFHVASNRYRKILFVLKDSRREVSLATYYIKNYSHLIPTGVEIWEFCTLENIGVRLK